MPSLRPFTLVALVLLLPACSSLLSRPNADKHTYSIALGDPEPLPPAARSSRTLQVRPLRALAPYDQTGLVYRTGEVEYENDFYHALLSPPGPLLTDAVRRWMSASRAFAHVAEPGGSLPSDRTLEISLDTLQGDYRNPAAPQAIVELRATLLPGDPAKAGTVLLQRTYRQAIPLADREPDTLVQGWQTALRSILQDLARDTARQ